MNTQTHKPNNTMTYTEFLELVTEMRDAQRSYFKNRTQGDLTNSKRLEKLVDNAIAEGKLYDESKAQETEDLQQMLWDESW